MNLSAERDRRYEEIVQYLVSLKNRGEEFAVWGAGNKGRYFCERVDPKGELISYIFDKDETKIGQHVDETHIVYDWKIYACKVRDIFLVMPSFAVDTIATLRGNGILTNCINISDWVVGGIGPKEQVRINTTTRRKVRDVSIGGLVIIYNPKINIVDNISSYIEDLNVLYVWDNSFDSHKCWFENLAYYSKLKYHHNGRNYGLGHPVNIVGRKMKNDSIDWLITFDQDSIAESGMLKLMKDYAESDIYDGDVSIISPVIKDPLSNFDYEPQREMHYITYMEQVIQSGAMQRVDILNELKYEEKYFIDQIDLNYCMRVRASGRKIIRLNQAALCHQTDDALFVIEDNNIRFYKGKYTPSRYYYQCRNTLYDADYFSNIDPDYSLQCINKIDLIKKLISYEDNIDECQYAIECAYEDYNKGVMGEWKRNCE